MEDLSLPSVGASFKKWMCCKHTPFKKPRPLLHARVFKKKGKKKERIKKIKKKNGPQPSWLRRAYQAGPGPGRPDPRAKTYADRAIVANQWPSVGRPISGDQKLPPPLA
jgi:hypothetical protein